MSAVHSSRYEALGKFREHSRSQSCSRRSQEQLLPIFHALKTSHVLNERTLTYEPIVKSQLAFRRQEDKLSTELSATYLIDGPQQVKNCNIRHWWNLTRILGNDIIIAVPHFASTVQLIIHFNVQFLKQTHKSLLIPAKQTKKLA